MTTKTDGGPAYPTIDANRAEDYGTYGMTLRDYFAAKAMQGLLANHGVYEEDAEYHSLCSEGEARKRESSITIDHAAVYAYAMADAMLKARENT